MKTSTTFALAAGALLLIAAGAGLQRMLDHGFSARVAPMAVERALAQRLRYLAVPKAQRQAPNPVPLTPDLLLRARAHFADHCALCHGNDGRGDTAVGRNLYPRAPDMRQPGTQSLGDGHLFYIIKNGVRLTGMPAWGQDTPEDDRETWELVHFIRRLPALTPQEVIGMEALNPKSRAEFEQEEAERRFLAGEDAPAPHHPKP